MAEALATKADGWERIDYIELRVDSHVAWRPHGPAVPAKDDKQLARR
jgi:hypothetical protein